MASRLLALAGLTYALLGCGPSPPAHVILISIDTLNRSALRPFNASAVPLPNIDAFAERAQRFQRAYTTAPWTLPAHASLFTGLYPDRHGAVHGAVMLDEALPGLAQRLREAGYQTVAFTDGGFIGATRGFRRGFERYDRWVDPDAPWAGPPLPRDGAFLLRAGEALFDRAVAFVEGRTDARPLFLFLHSYVVHDYFRARPWSVEGLPAHDDDRPHYLKVVTGQQPGTDQDWARLRDLYTQTTRHLDRGLGDLWEALDRSGLLDRSLVVLLSDHGEGLDPADGAIHHGGLLHPEQVRIPLLVAGPGVVPGDTDTLVSLADVAPSVLDWLGLPPLRDVDGRSFAGDLHGTSGSDVRHVYVMEHYYSWVEGRRRKAPEIHERPIGQVVIRGRHWYLGQLESGVFYEVDSAVRRLTPDLERDPELASLRALSASRRQYVPQAPPFVATPEVETQLRALGYVE